MNSGQKIIKVGAQNPIDMSPVAPKDLPTSDIDHSTFHMFLQEFYIEHEKIITEIDDLEAILISIKNNGISKEDNSKLNTFFTFFNDVCIPHHQKEEKALFPLLTQRLLEKGEHGTGEKHVTGVDVLEDDHLRVIQVASVAFNLFALCVRLPDKPSQLIVLDAAVNQGQDLVEQIRLHIYRENTSLFPLAQQYLSTSELDTMAERAQNA